MKHSKRTRKIKLEKIFRSILTKERFFVRFAENDMPVIYIGIRGWSKKNCNENGCLFQAINDNFLVQSVIEGLGRIQESVLIMNQIKMTSK